MAEAVVHVLRNALTLPRPGLSGDHRALALLLGVVLPERVGQRMVLRPVAAGQAGRDDRDQRPQDVEDQAGQ